MNQQITLFPPTPQRAPDRWKLGSYEEAVKYAHGLFCSDNWDDIQILTPDPDKPGRIVQAVRI